VETGAAPVAAAGATGGGRNSGPFCPQPASSAAAQASAATGLATNDPDGTGVPKRLTTLLRMNKIIGRF
jgi:hypothetical protein